MGIGAVMSAVLAFMVRSIIARFFLYFGLFFVTTEFIQVLQAAGIFPTAAALNGVWGGIPAGVWYFLDLFNFSMGFSALLSAYVTRFIVRRIPIIG